MRGVLARTFEAACIIPGMNLKPSIDLLNAEIEKLTAARDTLVGLQTPQRVAKLKPKQPTVSARSEAQRKRWAESKRKQRAKGTK